MGTITVGEENSTPIDLYYEDHGNGTPVVLIHGFPLSAASWEKQMPALLEGGYRVIAYDRRGFGRSSQPSIGYDYDTFAADLNGLMEKLDLRKAALVGFSMGGGEVARFIGRYGTGRVGKAAFLAAVPPHLLQTDDDPEGVPGQVFAGIKKAIQQDRPSFLTGFFKDFFNVDVLQPKGLITEEALRMSWQTAIDASPIATLACVDTWGTDFRPDLAKLDRPTLVLTGDSDRIVPAEKAANRTAKLVPGAKLVTIKDGPHAVNWTHAEEVNAELLAFLRG
ncbi:MAG: alpha/beta hydrolase [Chlorobia bacterium]|nr:alpha/beta hydrolase [Fimbriimonadaceae bacterium]